MKGVSSRKYTLRHIQYIVQKILKKLQLTSLD